jgi:hypothetical protein
MYQVRFKIKTGHDLIETAFNTLIVDYEFLHGIASRHIKARPLVFLDLPKKEPKITRGMIDSRLDGRSVTLGTFEIEDMEAKEGCQE